jgi:hypothetical protein
MKPDRFRPCTLRSAAICAVLAILLLPACGARESHRLDAEGIRRRARESERRLPPQPTDGSSLGRHSAERAGTAPPGEAGDVIDWARRFSPDAYIVGIGRGPDPGAAEAAARTDVALQVQAHLDATLLLRSSASGDELHTAIDERIAQSTTFDRLDLIELHRESLVCADVCSTVATLSRADAVARLLAELEATLAEIDSQIDGALRADDLATFSRSHRAALERVSAASAAITRIETIASAPPRELRSLRDRMGALATERARRMGALRVSVHVAAPLTHEIPALLGALEQLLARSGANVDPPGACTDQLLDVDGAIDCHRGLLGPQCAALLSYRYGPCAPAAPRDNGLLRACASAVHPSDEAGARRALDASVQQPTFRMCVADGLATRLALVP